MVIQRKETLIKSVHLQLVNSFFMVNQRKKMYSVTSPAIANHAVRE
jgi:hypothetical protein